MPNIPRKKRPARVNLRFFSKQIVVVYFITPFILNRIFFISEKKLKKDQENNSHSYADSSDSHIPTLHSKYKIATFQRLPFPTNMSSKPQYCSAHL